MKIQKQLLRFYFKIVSLISPRLSGFLAFKTFAKVRKKRVRKREEVFYEKAKHFKIPSDTEDINCYELGKPSGDLVFLIHGWESNAGSMSRFAFQLAELGHRVVSFDLPAHAKNKSNYTNLYECKEAFKSVLNFVEPTKPFHVISHSFGSAVSVYTLSQLDHEVDKFIFLTSPNSLLDVFKNFKRFIDLPEKPFSYLLGKAKSLLGEEVKGVNVDDKLKKISYNKLLLVHDELDTVISIENSKSIKAKNPEKAELKTYNKIGHYRMLWNDHVLQDTLHFIAS